MKNRIIIVGNGSSVRDNQWDRPVKDLPLWDIIKDEAHISLNYGFRYTNPTFACFYDASFYLSNLPELSKLPLVIGANKPDIRQELLANTILVPVKTKYLDNQWENGFYGSNLVGVLAISLAINLGYKEIILLGYDHYSVNGHTHYWEDEVDLSEKDHTGISLKYRGVGFKDRPNGMVHKTNNYDRGNSDEYTPFLHYKDVTIINCSVESKITQFDKIDYDELFAHLKNNPLHINQTETQKEIEDFIISKIKKD